MVHPLLQPTNLVLAHLYVSAQIQVAELSDVRMLDKVFNISSGLHLLKLKVLTEPKQQFVVLP